jgi:chloride channel protein, CIC family
MSTSTTSGTTEPPAEVSGLARVATFALGGIVGGLVGGFVVVGMTLVLKTGMEFVADQATWILLVVPLLGLALAALVLQGIGRSEGERRAAPGSTPRRRPSDVWRAFPPGAIRADVTSDVVETAGREEQFPWRLAPIRAVAILATVGLGGAMGTESPAVYLGAAAGACVSDRGRWWRRLMRPAVLAGGAAGVAALMGIPLVGTAYILELGRRRDAPISVERLVAALIGGTIGWGIDAVFGLSLIRLVVPKEAPTSLGQGVLTALFIGALSGIITSLTASVIYRAKKWHATAAVRFAIGALAAAVTAVTLAIIAVPRAAVGPGGGAIVWAETTNAVPMALLAVALLRGVATTAATAAGGCGGVFVPFLAVGDLAGRVFAPGLGIGNDLAGSAGAAAGIAGGYRLPFTAVAMVLGVGGPHLATLTSLATTGVAFLAAVGADSLFERLKKKRLPPFAGGAQPA